MALLARLLDGLTLGSKLVLKAELLLIQVSSAFLKVLDFNARLLFRLFALLHVLLQILLLDLELFRELLDTLA